MKRPIVKTRYTLLTVVPLVLGMQAAGAGEVGVEVTFDDGEIEIIRAYYHSHSDSGTKESHGKNKSKDKGLPPGIAKNLERGKPLEVDYLSGAVARRGQALGVPTLFHAMAAAILKPYAAGAGAG